MSLTASEPISVYSLFASAASQYYYQFVLVGQLKIIDDVVGAIQIIFVQIASNNIASDIERAICFPSHRQMLRCRVEFKDQLWQIFANCTNIDPQWYNSDSLFLAYDNEYYLYNYVNPITDAGCVITNMRQLWLNLVTNSEFIYNQLFNTTVIRPRAQ